MPSASQKKLVELQAGKKSLEDQVEMLRTVKEEAEKPEKEAKEEHQRRWEGMSGLARGPLCFWAGGAEAGGHS